MILLFIDQVLTRMTFKKKNNNTNQENEYWICKDDQTKIIYDMVFDQLLIWEVLKWIL